ncbi:unnamed protein product [Trichobilharzia regenti]|nr:unnamed protein product [Trichobilharzia regenti]
MIVQLASNDPCEFTMATEMLAPYCDGVDLNCGCPQSWAVGCGLGSALLREPEKIASIVRAARDTVPRWRSLNDSDPSALCETNDTEELSKLNESKEVQRKIHQVTRFQGPFSVSAKIRIPTSSSRSVGGESCDPIKLTVELVRRLAVMGVDWVTLHARTQHQRNRDPASWNIVQELVDCKIKHSSVGSELPIILNGDIRELKDAHHAYEMTGCHGKYFTRSKLMTEQIILRGFIFVSVKLFLFVKFFFPGVMAGRALLKTPYLFAPNCIKSENSLYHLYESWLHLSAQYTGGTNFAIIHQHAYWMMEQHLDKTRRLFLHNVGCFAGLVDWLSEQRMALKTTS